MSELRKVYVEVLATHRIDGDCIPESIMFADGTGYRVDRVRAVERMRLSVPALRFTVIVCGRQTYLYREDNGKWYVHVKDGQRRREAQRNLFSAGS
ncbi:MAG: hypothetical protein II794_02560 [Oscillospiraceae bacterium]|nr:hypothetical protein [Oscillospiraceae bacterium]